MTLSLKKILKSAGAAGAALAALSSIAFADAADGKPDYYKVSDGNSHIWLYGTFHALPEGQDWLKEGAAEALKGAETVYFELDQDDPNFQQNMLVAMQPHILATDGSNLANDLTEEEFAKLQKAMAIVQIPPQMTGNLNAGIAGLFLAGASVVEAGFDPEGGAEKVFQGLAAEAGHDIQGIESIAEQIGVFTSGDRADYIAFLKAGLADYDKAEEMLNSMLGMWVADDYEGMLALFKQSEGAAPAILNKLFDERNLKWIPKVEGLLEADTEAFIAVGAGHLLGETGLLNQLEQAGYTIERF